MRAWGRPGGGGAGDAVADDLDERGPDLRGDRGVGHRPGDVRRRPRLVRGDLAAAAPARGGGVVGHRSGEQAGEPRHRAEHGEREERPQAVALPGGGFDGAGRHRCQDRECHQHLLHDLGARGPLAAPGIDGQAPCGQTLPDRGGGGGGGDELPEPVHARGRRPCCAAEGVRLYGVGRRGLLPYAGPDPAVGADRQHPGQVQRRERHLGDTLPAAGQVRGLVQAERPGVRPALGIEPALQRDAGEGRAEQRHGRTQEDVDPHRRPRLPRPVVPCLPGTAPFCSVPPECGPARWPGQCVGPDPSARRSDGSAGRPAPGGAWRA